MRKNLRKIFSASLSFMMVSTTFIIVSSLIMPESVVASGGDPISPFGKVIEFAEDEILVLGKISVDYNDVMVYDRHGSRDISCSPPHHENKDYDRAGSGDFDGDWDDEMVLLEGDGQDIQVWDDHLDTTPYGSYFFDVGGDYVKDLACGDFNNDGKDEIVLLGKEVGGTYIDDIKIVTANTIQLFPDWGGQSPYDGPWEEVPDNYNDRNWDAITAGDFDNDCDAEIALLDANNKDILVWDPWDPNAPCSTIFWDVGGVSTKDIAAGDFDPSGDDEIVVLGQKDNSPGSGHNDYKIYKIIEVIPGQPYVSIQIFPETSGHWAHLYSENYDYDRISCGDTNKDGIVEIVVLDMIDLDGHTWIHVTNHLGYGGSNTFLVDMSKTRDIACMNREGDQLILKNYHYAGIDPMQSTVAIVYEPPSFGASGTDVEVTFSASGEETEFETFTSLVGFGVSVGLSSETYGTLKGKYEKQWKDSNTNIKRSGWYESQTFSCNDDDNRIYSITEYNAFTYEVYSKSGQEGDCTLFDPISTSLTDQNYEDPSPDHIPGDIPSYYGDSLEITSPDVELDYWPNIDIGYSTTPKFDEDKNLKWTKGEETIDSTEIIDKKTISYDGPEGLVVVEGELLFEAGYTKGTSQNHEEALDVKVIYYTVDSSVKTYHAESKVYWRNIPNGHTYLVIDHKVNYYTMGNYYWTPQIESSTHPNEAEWYSHNDPSFTWPTPASDYVNGYSYVLDQNPSTIPDNVVNTGSSISYTDLEDGTWYFHVKAKDDWGNWRPCDHYQINIDTTAPNIDDVSLTTNVVIPGQQTQIEATITDTYSEITDAEAYIYEPDSTDVITYVNLEYMSGVGKYIGTIEGGVTMAMDGMYVIEIYTEDNLGNCAHRKNQACFVVTDTPSDVVGMDTIIGIDHDPSTTLIKEFNLDGDDKVDLKLEMTLNIAVTDSSISVVEYSANPEQDLNQPHLGKFFEIEANQELDDAIESVKITICYKQEDVPDEADEIKYRLYWWDESISNWEVLEDPVDNPWVNTVTNKVWATVDHFSVYAPYGNWKPTADAGSDQSVNEGNLVTFNGIGSSDQDGYITQYEWDFESDGVIDQIGIEASFTYMDDSTYTVTLTVTDDDGSIGTDTCVITVMDLAPTAGFSFNPQPQDEGSPVSFTDESISYPDDITDWDWNFAGLGTSDDQDTQFTFMDDGFYSVSLTVTDDDGSQDTIFHSVEILDLAPVADFSWSPTTQYEGEYIDFTDSSSSYPDDIVGWNWNFGDGSESTLQNPSHQYGDNGFDVTLYVTDDDGSIDSITKTITVLNVAPTVQAGYDQQTDEGTQISFEGSFTDPGWLDTHTIEWDFGDGNGETGTLTPDHTYGDNGVYTVTLTITDDDGGVGIDTLTVTVNNVAPQVTAAALIIPGFEGTPVEFTSDVIDPGFLDTHTYEWDFGDGNTDDTPEPEHSYADNGIYTVTLTVWDDDGGQGSYSFPLTIENLLPIPGPMEVYMYVDFTLIVNGEDWDRVDMFIQEDGVDIHHVWLEHPRGSPDYQMITISNVKCDMTKHYTANIIYTPSSPPYNTAGVFISIVLTFDDYTQEIYQHVAHPLIPSTHGWYVDFSDAFIGHEITFEASAEDPGADDLTFVWDFGDGNRAGPNFYPNDGTFPMQATDIVYHAYSSSGEYNVFILISDDDGGIIGIVYMTIRIGIDAWAS